MKNGQQKWKIETSKSAKQDGGIILTDRQTNGLPEFPDPNDNSEQNIAALIPSKGYKATIVQSYKMIQRRHVAL